MEFGNNRNAFGNSSGHNNSIMNPNSNINPNEDLNITNMPNTNFAGNERLESELKSLENASELNKASDLYSRDPKSNAKRTSETSSNSVSQGNNKQIRNTNSINNTNYAKKQTLNSTNKTNSNSNQRLANKINNLPSKQGLPKRPNNNLDQQRKINNRPNILKNIFSKPNSGEGNLQEKLKKQVLNKTLVGRALSKFMDNGTNKAAKKEAEEKTPEAMVVFKIPYKVLLTIAVMAAPVFILVVFIVLLVSGSQVYLNVIGLGEADSVSDNEANKKIAKAKDDDVNKEIEDKDDDKNDNNDDKNDDSVSYYFDIFIDDDEETSLQTYKYVSRKRPHQEANLDKLRDFYPDIDKYVKNSDEKNVVYRFFSKLYCINKYYKQKYKVNLDTALIMSVLRLQSTDIADVFRSNVVGYTDEQIDVCFSDKSEDKKTFLSYEDFDSEKDWSSYKPTKTNSAHDIEVLAQAMIEEGNNSSSSDVDDDDNKKSQNPTPTKTGKEAIDKMTEIALKEAEDGNVGGLKYQEWYETYGDWCAMFVSWLFDQVGGLNKYIKSSAIAGGTYGYSGIVKDSMEANLGAWYEDECTDPKTIPKAGDVIVFDPRINGVYTPNPTSYSESKFFSSHVGYVYKVDDTYVYTVEGNSGDEVKAKSYERKTHCGTVGTQGINGYFRPNY